MSTLAVAVSVLQLAPSSITTHADLAVFLVVGVLAGAHCLGMCGPLVGIYADRVSRADSATRRETLTMYEVRQHALFNIGRTVGYSAVGVLFGLAGGTVFATVDSVSALGNGVRAVTGLAVGSFIIFGGLTYLIRGSATTYFETIPIVSGLYPRVSELLTSRLDRLATTGGITGLGAVHAVLPCPIIYPAYLYAFAIGDPVRGGLSMALLGLGTIPTLFAYGTMLGSLTATQRAGLHRVLGVAFLALGYVLVSHGLALLGIDVPHVDLPYYQPLT